MTTDTMSVVVPKEIIGTMLAYSSVLEVDPGAYNPATNYPLDGLASISTTKGAIDIYTSKQPANSGHDPLSSPAWWYLNCSIYQAYSAVATYALGDRVQDNAAHLVYESAISSNTGQALTDATKWIPVGATNKWAAYDQKIGTSTVGASPLKNTLHPGPISGLAIFEANARTVTVEMLDAPLGSIVYSKTVDMDGSFILSIYDWFFAEFEQKSDVVLTDLPSQFTNCELNITLTSTTGLASAGVIKPGSLYEIGTTLSGAKVGIVSYTKKIKNDFGDVELISRPYSKRATFSVLTEKVFFNRIYKLLASLDSKLCIFVGTNAPGFEPLLIYGYPVDFSIDIQYSNWHLCALEIEGVI